MNVGLIDVDGGSFPNLVLMKLSTWYKQHGHKTVLLTPEDVLEGNLFISWDKLVGASVFTENAQIVRRLRDCGAHIAGSGTDSKETLPSDIEHEYPDYDLYGIKDVAYGFLTRGCPRGCPFCIVAGKEGRKSYKVANLSEWWHGQKSIKLLDPNLLACSEHMDLLKQLVDSGSWCDITQGFDARLLTDANVELINELKIKMLHFAWDNPRDEYVPRNLLRFAKKRKLKDIRKYRVYVLTNYWSTFDEDLMRVYWLRDHGYDPYVMIYDKPNAPKKIRHLARWVNDKFIFRVVETFDEYKKGSFRNGK